MYETPITVVGRVISEPSTGRFHKGDMVRSFRIVSQARRFDKVANEWVDGDRLYLRVNCWRRMADGVEALAKGDNVLVTGRFRTSEWESENGERRISLEIDANAIGPDLNWHTVTINRSGVAATGPPDSIDPDRHEPATPDERTEVITEPVAA